MNKDKLNSIKDKLTVFKYDTVDLNKSQKSNDLYDNIKQLDKQIARCQQSEQALLHIIRQRISHNIVAHLRTK